MQKREIIILFLILAVFVGFVVYNEMTKEKNFIPSERSEKFYIIAGESLPVFTREIIVDPFKIKVGERQFFSIWAKDLQGIEKVTATTTTDIGDKIIELKLVEGTNEEGRWQGSWIARNISIKDSYSTTFQATNKENKEAKINLTWQVNKENLITWLRNLYFSICSKIKNP
jgi:hypothetical protein